jgi:transposase
MPDVSVPDGYEIRSELIRLYLEQEHPAILFQLQDEVLNVTNHIVRSRKDVKNACIAYALRHNLVSQPPGFPVKPSLPTPQGPEDNKIVKAAWDEYYETEKLAAKDYKKWLDSVFKAVKGIPECNWRNDDYKTLRGIYQRIGDSVLYRDAVKRVNSTKGARPKKSGNWIPLVWANSSNLKSSIQTGQFYGNRRGMPFYNALITVPGIKTPFLGRLRRPLPGKPVQGVTLIQKADGWYAVVKCLVPKRKLSQPTLTPIGVDVGQTDLVATSDDYTEHNPRDKKFKEQKAAIQSKGDLSKDANFQKNCQNRVARMDQKRKRWVSHWINSVLLPKLEKHSFVFIEKLSRGFKSDKGSLSCMHIILNAIKQRLGDLDNKGKLGPTSRVMEVNPAYTSQTCSYCGEDKEIVREGKYFACLKPGCDAILDADINAARNILNEGMKLIVA